MNFILGDDILGSGSYGSVFKGSMPYNGSDKVIAIKRMENDGHRNIFRKNALKEYEILLAVGKHDNIVELMGFEADTQFFYILMEFCTEGSLDSYLEKVNPDLEKKIKIMHGCASGLGYMHSRKPQVVHRDVKLGNILIQRMGKGRILAKIADFGLSTAFDPEGRKQFMTTNTGTMAFRAPEMFLRGPMCYTIAVDIFALGLVYLVMFNYDMTKSLEPNPVTLLDCPWQHFGHRLMLLKNDKKQMPELFTITTSEPASVTQIKLLIANMTQFEASDRIVMSEVECLLEMLVDTKSHSESCILQLKSQVTEMAEKESLLQADVQAKDAKLKEGNNCILKYKSQVTAMAEKQSFLQADVQAKDAELKESYNCILKLKSQVTEMAEKQSLLHADVQANDAELKEGNKLTSTNVLTHHDVKKTDKEPGEQIFLETDVTLNLQLLAETDNLHSILAIFCANGVSFRKASKGVYQASGSLSAINSLHRALSINSQSESKVGISYDSRKNPSIVFGNFEDSVKTRIEELVLGNPWGELRSTISMKKFKYNIALLCYVIGKHFKEIKGMEDSIIMFKYHANDEKQYVRLCVKGEEKQVDQLFKFIDGKCTYELGTLDTIYIDLMHQIHTIPIILNDILGKYDIKFIMVYNSKLYIVVRNSDVSACSEYLKNLKQSQNDDVNNILDAFCINHCSYSFMASQKSCEEEPLDLGTFTETSLPISSGVADNIDMYDQIRKLYCDIPVLDYMVTCERELLQNLERKYDIVLDKRQINKGILSIVAGKQGTKTLKYLEVVHNEIGGQIQKYISYLETDEIHIRSVKEKWNEIESQVHEQALGLKIRVQKFDAEQRITFTGLKDDLKPLLHAVNINLFPEKYEAKRYRVVANKKPPILQSATPPKQGSSQMNSIQAPNYQDYCARFKHNYSDTTIYVVNGDITQMRVDAIVNNANEHLAHGAGVAHAIAKAAGKKLEQEGNQFILQNGPLRVSHNCITTGGLLPACYVIHAVGPRWDKYRKDSCADELKDTFVNILITVASQNLSSVAIPSISSGIFGMPQALVADIMVTEIVKFFHKNKTGIKEVYLIDIDYNMIKMIKSQLFCSSKAGQVTFVADGQLSNNAGGSSQTATSFGETKDKQKERILVLRSENYEAASNNVFPHRFANRASEAEVPSSSSSENSHLEKQTNKDENDAEKDDDCCICMCTMTNPKTLKCKHKFCTECIEIRMKIKPVCPICGEIFGALIGNQPHGTIRQYVTKGRLPGYPDCGTIVIHYDIPSGTQTDDHPNPGQRYHGARRTGYLPDNKEGRKVAKLLHKAFESKLIFTVGRSVTSGQENVVTWNDIHHKTNVSGGAQGFGYPDPDYLKRVQEGLAAKGIK